LLPCATLHSATLVQRLRDVCATTYEPTLDRTPHPFRHSGSRAHEEKGPKKNTMYILLYKQLIFAPFAWGIRSRVGSHGALYGAAHGVAQGLLDQREQWQMNRNRASDQSGPLSMLPAIATLRLSLASRLAYALRSELGLLAPDDCGTLATV
jgi:hypothetical protein